MFEVAKAPPRRTTFGDAELGRSKVDRLLPADLQKVVAAARRKPGKRAQTAAQKEKANEAGRAQLANQASPVTSPDPSTFRCGEAVWSDWETKTGLPATSSIDLRSCSHRRYRTRDEGGGRATLIISP